MARCGCAGTSCSCVIQGGAGIVVDGAGTETNPYVISGGDGASGGVLTVLDTETIDLSLLGTGTPANPYVLSGNATLDLDQLNDVVATAPVDGYVLAWNGTTWQPVPPTTAPVGAIAVGDGLLGDGSGGDPLRLDPASLAGFVVPTGTVTAFAGAAAPSGYLLCNGAAVGRAAFADLFALIGITYGAGNGTTTFNVPNLTSRSPVGAGVFDLGEMVGAANHTHATPAHTHSIPNHTHSVPSHDHDLDTSARALMTLSNDDIYVRRVNANPDWTANWRTNINVGQGPSGVTHTTAIPLQGATNSAGPWTTGASGAGSTGSGGAGSTGSASSLPPSLGLNFIIKT